MVATERGGMKERSRSSRCSRRAPPLSYALCVAANATIPTPIATTHTERNRIFMPIPFVSSCRSTMAASNDFCGALCHPLLTGAQMRHVR